MASTKRTVSLAALALVALVCHAAIDVNSDHGTAKAYAINVNANGDDTASIPDFDGDGTIGFGDFLKFAAKFGLSQGDVGYDAQFDLNDDAEIGFADFLIFTENFGKEVTPPSGGDGSSSPDLIVESSSVSDNTLTAGQSFTLSATVRNQGTGSSAATTLRYYRSSDATIYTSDTEVGTDSVNGLSASGTSAESISLNAPSSAGTYYYGACVASVSGESDTDNNCSSPVRVTVTASQEAGYSDFDLAPDNSRPEGITFGNGRFYVVDYRDEKVYAYHASGQRDAASDFDLTPDNSGPLGITFDNGRFYVVDEGRDEKVYAYHASGQRDAASDFDLAQDNSHPTKIIFGNGRLYVVDSWDDEVYAYHASGQRDAASDFDLAPNNSRPAGITFGNGRFYVVDSEDDKVYAYHASGQRDAASDFDLAPNYSHPAGITFDNGRFYVVDSEDDKVYVLNIGPDLVVAPSVSNTNPETGESFVFTSTVRNRGDRTSTATTVRYYRSGDRRITTSDTEVGMGGISSLPTYGTSDVSISLTAPSSVGKYYYGTCVDSVSGESDTQNNCSSAVAVFSGGPFPPYDLTIRIINFDAPSVAYRYSQIRMTVEVINDGPKASKPAKLRFSGGYEFNRDIPALEPSETVLYYRTVGTARSGTTTYQVCVTAPDEENIFNNCAFRSVTYH